MTFSAMFYDTVFYFSVIYRYICFFLHIFTFGAIQVLRNAEGGGRVSDFPKKSVAKMYGSTLLALRGVGGCRLNKRYITLECPPP